MTANRIIKLIIALIACSQILSAQTKGLTGIDPDKLFQEESSNKLTRELLTKTDIMPVGNVVDAAHYRVGPGDAISIQNLTASLTQEVVIVTPESSILLPRIGEISLAGKTLAQAKQIITDSIKKRNSSSMVYVSLYQPRTVLINLKGDVAKPGAYSLPASYRVSTAIKVANYLQSQNQGMTNQASTMLILKDKKRQTERTYSKAGLSTLPAYSSRNITVQHIDGIAENADVEKAFALADAAYDPYIREGDEIFVPFNKETYPTISISGAVLRPISVPFKKGDKASFLLKLGGGFTTEAVKEAIFLFTPENNQVARLNCDSALNLIGSDFDLSAGSSIIVTEAQNETEPVFGTVALTGEVNHPGTYIIKNGETKIKEIIDKAGGFKSEAYLPMSYVVRRSDQNLLTQNPGGEYYEYFQRSDLSMEDTARFMIDVNFRKPYVSCDLEALYDFKQEKYNIPLKDGDVIVVPQNPKTVYIFGQVNNPGYVPFEKDKSLEWYVEKAGGYASGAEKARARIIRSKNRVWVKPEDSTKVFAGDEIYVPKPKDMPPGMEMQAYYLIATAIGTIIQISYLIITLFKK